MQERAHRRLEFPRPGRPVPDYANLYRFGDPAAAGPLLVYVGGAITERQHAERFHTEPLPVVAGLEAALREAPLARLDLLVLPSPPRRIAPGELLDAFEDHFHDELLPALGVPPATALGFVGYSLGAHLATHLALGEERARALVTLGGAGIAEAARAAGRVVAERLLVALFHNQGDGLPPPARALGAFDPRLKPWVMPPRDGGHDFADYAANGSVAEGFGLALDVVR